MRLWHHLGWQGHQGFDQCYNPFLLHASLKEGKCNTPTSKGSVFLVTQYSSKQEILAEIFWIFLRLEKRSNSNTLGYMLGQRGCPWGQLVLMQTQGTSGL